MSECLNLLRPLMHKETYSEISASLEFRQARTNVSMHCTHARVDACIHTREG